MLATLSADIVEGPQLDGTGDTRLVDVPPRDAPPLRLEGQADGAPDQPRAHDEGSTFGAHR